jgi:hypothetical protein
MAELDFSHTVSEVPQHQQNPAPYHRTEKIEQNTTPDFQSAISNYASSQNWMSSVGSFVANRASNAIAEKLGTEIGKNPKGDLGVIPLTEFDDAMQKSYVTQSQATLGLQANKLITESNLEVAKVSRITPELIRKTNSSVSIGLQNIFNNAPSAIQANLQSHYGNLMLTQNADLTERMLREQKQDRTNNTALASQMNNEHAYTFGLHGNDKAAQAAIETTTKLSQADVASRLMTPEQAKSNIDAARKSYLTGKMIHDYNSKKDEEKPAYLKSIVDKKPDYLSDTDYMDVTNGLMTFVNHQNALLAQDQSLSLAKFNTSIAMNPLAADMPQQLQELKRNVSPIAYEQAQLKYVNTVKAFNTEQGNVNNAIASWNDPSSFSRLTEKGINKAFDTQVNHYVQQRQEQSNPISVEEAEVQVAASAGGKIPIFEKELQNKLLSGNPANIQSASNQIDMLNHMKRGSVYEGVSTKAKAIATLFQQQRGSMPDSDLARQITDNLSNVDEKMQKTLDNSWSLILSQKGVGGMGKNKSFADFGLQTVGLSKDKMGGDYFGTIYGNDIYNQLNSNFTATRGDYNAAVKMTQDYVDNHYSDTYVNGTKQKSDSSVEKYLGYEGNDVTPYVQQDILNHLSESFSVAKTAYPDDYWETLPLKNKVVEAVRHVKTKDGIKQYRYPINLVGREGNQWDVSVQTPYGQRSLFLVAPHLGITTYNPNKEAIDKAYKSRISHFPLISPKDIHNGY